MQKKIKLKVCQRPRIWFATCTFSIILNGFVLSAMAQVAPSNDNFANAEIVNAFATGNNIGATIEAGEPIHNPDNPDNSSSIWYSWQAPSTEGVFISTENSNFDTVLAIYTGTALNNLVQIAFNDDSGGPTSRVSLNANTGVIYYIAVDGYSPGDDGDVSLNIVSMSLPPSNDNFANAEVFNGFATGNNTGATIEAGEPNHNPDDPDNSSSIWYSWQAPNTERVFISTEDSDFDTVLAIYTGTALNNLAQVVFNDDDDLLPGRLTSRVSFNANAGVIYYIAVDGYNPGNYGDVNLDMSFEPAVGISGLVSLPAGETAPRGGIEILMFVTYAWPGDDSGSTARVTIIEGENSVSYAINSYMSGDEFDVQVFYTLNFDGYLGRGYYAENAQTIPNEPRSHLTPTAHTDINLTILKQDDMCFPIKVANGVALICL